MPPLLPETGRWILAALACYRLAELVAIDEGPFSMFGRLRRWAGLHSSDFVRENVAELVHCPYCVGVWFAVLCGALALWPTGAGDLFLAIFGLAGAQAALEGLSKGERNDDA